MSRKVKKVYSTWFIKSVDAPLFYAVGLRNRVRGGTPYDHVIAQFRYEWDAKAFLKAKRAKKKEVRGD